MNMIVKTNIFERYMRTIESKKPPALRSDCRILRTNPDSMMWNEKLKPIRNTNNLASQTFGQKKFKTKYIIITRNVYMGKIYGARLTSIFVFVIATLPPLLDTFIFFIFAPKRRPHSAWVNS